MAAASAGADEDAPAEPQPEAVPATAVQPDTAVVQTKTTASPPYDVAAAAMAVAAGRPPPPGSVDRATVSAITKLVDTYVASEMWCDDSGQYDGDRKAQRAACAAVACVRLVEHVFHSTMERPLRAAGMRRLVTHLGIPLSGLHFANASLSVLCYAIVYGVHPLWESLMDLPPAIGVDFGPGTRPGGCTPALLALTRGTSWQHAPPADAAAAAAAQADAKVAAVDGIAAAPAAAAAARAPVTVAPPTDLLVRLLERTPDAALRGRPDPRSNESYGESSCLHLCLSTMHSCVTAQTRIARDMAYSSDTDDAAAVAACWAVASDLFARWHRVFAHVLSRADVDRGGGTDLLATDFLRRTPLLLWHALMRRHVADDEIATDLLPASAVAFARAHDWDTAVRDPLAAATARCAAYGPALPAALSDALDGGLGDIHALHALVCSYSPAITLLPVTYSP